MPSTVACVVVPDSRFNTPRHPTISCATLYTVSTSTSSASVHMSWHYAVDVMSVMSGTRYIAS